MGMLCYRLSVDNVCTGWLRLHRDTIDTLHAYKTAHGLATWYDTVAALLAAGAGDRGGNGRHPDSADIDAGGWTR